MSRRQTSSSAVSGTSLNLSRSGFLRLFVGSIGWSLVMSATAAFSLWDRGWENLAAAISVVALFALGGAISYAPGVLAGELVARHKRPETRFAAFLVMLAVATLAATAFLFAMHYRHYYASWHEPSLTIGWIFQFVFTSGVAVYHFAVLGLRMFIPIGLPVLIGVCLWHAARPR